MKSTKYISSYIDSLLSDEDGVTLKKYAYKIAGLILILFIISIISLIFDWGGKLGPFGDFIGGVANPLLTFLTFICLIKTIFMQRDELSLTRKEYTETKKVLKTQSIESTFYNGINLHHEIVNNLKIKLTLQNALPNLSAIKDVKGFDGNEFSGRDCFSALITALSQRYTNVDAMVCTYKELNRNRNEWFGHYFRNLYRILKTIDDLPQAYVSDEEKTQYCHTLRAQLSSNELFVLMLNCYEDVCDNGQFRDLLSRYQMLEHLPIKDNYDQTLSIAGIATTDYNFLKYFKVTEEEIINNRKKLSLKKEPGGAFGKNHDFYFPKDPRKKS